MHLVYQIGLYVSNWCPRFLMKGLLFLRGACHFKWQAYLLMLRIIYKFCLILQASQGRLTPTQSTAQWMRLPYALCPTVLVYRWMACRYSTAVLEKNSLLWVVPRDVYKGILSPAPTPGRYHFISLLSRVHCYLQYCSSHSKTCLLQIWLKMPTMADGPVHMGQRQVFLFGLWLPLCWQSSLLPLRMLLPGVWAGQSFPLAMLHRNWFACGCCPGDSGTSHSA